MITLTEWSKRVNSPERLKEMADLFCQANDEFERWWPFETGVPDSLWRRLRAWVGFKQIGYEYDRDERQAGETKYSWKKLFELAFNGIFNFSDFPVKIITRLGFMTVFFSLIYFVYNVYRKVVYNDVPQGFTATILAIILFSGVQLISLGLIGEYVLRIYNQVRNRPLFVVDKIIQEGVIQDKSNENNTHN